MTDDELTKLCENMKQCFPKGIKYGTSNPWRDHTSILKNRFYLLFKHFGYEPNESEVLKATRKYVESFDGDYTYMRTLKYFIIKRAVVDGTTEYVSDLLTYISMLDDNEDIVNNNNWVTNLK